MINAKTILILLILTTVTCFAQEPKILSLPKPDMQFPASVMEALQTRSSARAFSDKALSYQEIANIVWAGNGINRPETGKRTAPSAHNWQDIMLYVFLPEGVYLYLPKEHALQEILHEYLRQLAGLQEYVKTAPLNIILVSDQAKMENTSAEDKALLSGANAAFVAENIYLYCAGKKLAVVVRAMIDKATLAKRLNLSGDQKIIMGQTIGFPK
jgi:hypothetical protein